MNQLRDPASQGNPQNIFQEHRAPFQTIVNDVSFSLFSGDHRGDVLQKIDSAIFTNAALPLFMAAGGALITQSCVTPSAEPRDVACFIPTFRTVHG